MKGVIYLSIIVTILFLGMGCQTVPRHLVIEEVVVHYYEPILIDEPIGGPHPIPDLPEPIIVKPVINNPDPSRNLQTENPGNGGSYGTRDPLKGGDKRESGETKTYPPVRKPEQNDRAQ